LKRLAYSGEMPRCLGAGRDEIYVAKRDAGATREVELVALPAPS
jgi:hypothetical protein